MAIVALFRRCPLRSKKQNDFERWAVIAQKLFETDNLLYEDVKDLCEQLVAGRREYLDHLERF